MDTVIKVCYFESDEPLQITARSRDEILELGPLQKLFPGVCGLKYKCESTGLYTYCQLEYDGKNVAPPPNGWGDRTYIFVYNTDVKNRIGADSDSQEKKLKGKRCISGPPKKKKIFKDFYNLYIIKKDCDVVFRVKDQEFPAHRNILSARSSVFESMFRNDMKEKDTGEIVIKVFDPSIFSDFLSFLYCGDVSISKDNMISFFNLADKYDVQDLVEECVEFIKENLSVKMFFVVVSLLLLFPTTNFITELKNTLSDFFIRKSKIITDCPQWLPFLIEDPVLCNEIFIKPLSASKMD